MALSEFEEQELREIREEQARRLRLTQSEADISAQIAEEEGVGGALLSSIGRGFQTVGRGAQTLAANVIPGSEEWKNELLADAEAEAELFKPLEKEFPVATAVGEAVGEAAPFAVAGALGAPASMAGRMALTGGLGAAEGAAIAAGTGQEIAPSAGLGGAVGAGAELVFPRLSRIAGGLFRKVTGKPPAGTLITPDGGVSEDMRKVLDQAGMSIDDLFRYTKEFPQARTPDELVRQGIFDDLEIPTTRSRITQEQGDFLTERRLSRDTTDASQELRNRLVDESAAFNIQAQRQINDLGIPENVGDTVKEALEARVKGMDEKASELYGKIAQLNDGAGIPMTGDKVLMGLSNDGKAYSNYKALPASDRAKVSDLMIEYGLDTNPEAVAAWSKRNAAQGGTFGLPTTPKSLNTSSFNDLLRDLNAMMDPMNKQLNSVVGALKSGVNKEIDELDRLIGSGEMGLVGKNAKDAIKAVRRANKYYRAISKVKDEKELVGALIKKRAGSFDEPFILASQVADKIKGGGRFGTVESTDRLVKELRRAGPDGVTALGNIQASVLMDFMEKALPKSGKLLGETGASALNWSGPGFSRAVDKFGRDKLEALFRNNPEGLARIAKMEVAGQLKTAPSAVAKSSGTADDMLSATRGMLDGMPLIKEYMRMTPTGQALNAGLGKGSKKIQEKNARQQTQQMLDSSPVLRDKLEFLKLQYPRIAGLIGASSISSYQGEK